MCKCIYSLSSSFCSNKPKWRFSVRLSREPLKIVVLNSSRTWGGSPIRSVSAQLRRQKLSFWHQVWRNSLIWEEEKNVFLWELDVGLDKLCKGPGPFSCSNWKCLLLLSFVVSQESDPCLILLPSSGLLPCLGLQMEVFWRDLVAVEEPQSGNSLWCPDMLSIPLREAGMKY